MQSSSFKVSSTDKDSLACKQNMNGQGSDICKVVPIIQTTKLATKFQLGDNIAETKRIYATRVPQICDLASCPEGDISSLHPATTWKIFRNTRGKHVNNANFVVPKLPVFR